MTMKIADPNLKTAILASLACGGLILMIALVSSDPVSDALQRRPSTFFTDQTGTRAVYLVAGEVLPSVEQWRRPLTDLVESGAEEGGTLIVMGPSTPLTPSEAIALDTWVVSGGQLILATGAGWPVRSVTEGEAAGDYLDRYGIDRIELAEGGDPLASAVTETAGSGQIVYIPDSYAFSNRSLEDPDKAVWLAGICARWEGGVLFDEYHHGFGQRRGLAVLIGVFLVSPWGLACLQLVLAGIVYILGTKRRFGKPVEELPVERTAPTETVEALGSLLEAARARVLAARTIQQYLNVQLSGLLGYRVDVSDPEIRERLAGRGDLDRATDLEEFVQAVDHLSASGLSPDEALIRVAVTATSIRGSLSHGADRNQQRALAG